MKSKVTAGFLGAACIAFLIVFFSPACASTPIKQKATLGLQASETALEAGHNIERSLCFINPGLESGTHCTNAVAAQAKLDDVTHVKIAAFFEAAFTVQKKATIALSAWKAGDPVPATVLEYQTDINKILAVAQNLLPPGASSLLDKVQTAVNEAATIVALLGVK